MEESPKAIKDFSTCRALEGERGREWKVGGRERGGRRGMREAVEVGEGQEKGGGGRGKGRRGRGKEEGRRGRERKEWGKARGRNGRRGGAGRGEGVGVGKVGGGGVSHRAGTDARGSTTSAMLHSRSSYCNQI